MTASSAGWKESSITQAFTSTTSDDRSFPLALKWLTIFTTISVCNIYFADCGRKIFSKFRFVLNFFDFVVISVTMPCLLLVIFENGNCTLVNIQLGAICGMWGRFNYQWPRIVWSGYMSLFSLVFMSSIRRLGEITDFLPYMTNILTIGRRLVFLMIKVI
jgi:hypothetical protein